MTIITTAQTLPRLLVQSYLRAARFPLNAAARVARQQDNDQWPPTLAFESLEAGIETVIGSMLRDAALLESGQLRQAKIAQLRKAAELTTVADQERAAADRKAERRREQIASQRAQTDRQEAKRKQDIERQAEANKQKVETKAAKKAAVAREVKANQNEAIDRQERVAKTSALSSQSRALNIVKEALEAEEKVELIDETIEGKKAARKAH